MTANPPPKKPQVIGIVGMGIILSLLALLDGAQWLQVVTALVSSGSAVPYWITPLAYAFLGFGAVGFLASLLILLYKRIGLYLGAVFWFFELALNVVLLVIQILPLTVTQGLEMLVMVAILFFLFIYLTREPEKTFFK